MMGSGCHSFTLCMGKGENVKEQPNQIPTDARGPQASVAGNETKGGCGNGETNGAGDTVTWEVPPLASLCRKVTGKQ